ncbi:MAG: hypothetical protein ACYC9J_06945 [Sulfuricaulis sp.]
MKYKPWKRPPIKRSDRIITVKRTPNDIAARIDLVFGEGRIRRFLRVQSHRLRQLLKLARTKELEPVPLPANVEQVIIDSREELKLVVKTGVTRLNASFPEKRPAHADKPDPRPTSREPVVVAGRMSGSGEELRSLRNKSFTSPYIELEVDELGGRPRRFYGVDIPRAIKESGAMVGDRVRLKQLGYVPAFSDGASSNKRAKLMNAYEIEVVGSAMQSASDAPAAYTE